MVGSINPFMAIRGHDPGVSSVGLMSSLGIFTRGVETSGEDSISPSYAGRLANVILEVGISIDLVVLSPLSQNLKDVVLCSFDNVDSNDIIEGRAPFCCCCRS